MRRDRLVAPVQLPLELDGITNAPEDRWLGLPESCQDEVVRLLARAIARGVIDVDQEGNNDDE